MIDIHKVIDISKKAGKLILDIYNTEDLEVQSKSDQSPLTKADLASNSLLINELAKVSNFPIVSEELTVEYEKRSKWHKFWLIDPLDGTKDFIAKNGQFTINIALIENERPILGIVHIPLNCITYYGELGKGSFKDGKKIFNNSRRKDLISSDSNFHSTPEVKNFFKKHNISKIQKYGAAIKICKLAEGKIDVYPRFNGTKEWDTAASHIIANEAGCKLIDISTRKELTYNKPCMKNNHFIASRNNLDFI